MTDEELKAIMAESRARKKNKRSSVEYIRKEPEYDSIYTMEDGTATFLYIIIMLVGTIFKDRIWIWFMSTLVFVLFKKRHQGRKK